MDKKFIKDIRIIKHAINSRKLVVFAGAGVSIDSGAPSWGTLVNELKEDIEIPSNENDALRIAQMYFNERDSKEYLEKIREVLKHKKINHNTIHDVIFDLNPEHILTTNYDDLFEQVIKKKAFPFSVVNKDEHFPFSLNTNLLVKIHGDLEDGNVVLKEDDYLDFSSKHPLIEGFIKSVFASKVVLFVGYSFSDLDLKYILQDVRTILGKNFQNAYLISTDANLHNAQRKYLKEKGINVISFSDADFINNNQSENYIENYLNGKNALKRKIDLEIKDLQNKGKKLYKILKFISTYDSFNEKINNLTPVEKIFHSLERFKELKSVPPEFIANLFPFSLNHKNYHLTGYSLLVTNKEIANFFFNDVDWTGDYPKILNYNSDCLNDSTKKELNEKLKGIIKHLNFCLIYFIKRENENTDSLGTKGTDEKYIDIRRKQKLDCNCFNCTYGKLNFIDFILMVTNASISETSSLDEDMQLAYSHYKLGNFSKSFQGFKEAGNKAWRNGSYITYFISQLNCKRLRNFIWSDLYLNRDDINRIVAEIDKINLDKILVQLTEIDKDQYTLLKSLKDDKYIHLYSDKIEEQIQNIIKVYEMYKNGRGTLYGPNYYWLLETELAKLYIYVQNNNIIYDEFSDFRNVFSKAIDALIASYATNNTYDGKLKQFNSFSLEIAIHYCITEDLKKAFQRYNIKELEIDKIELKRLIEKINNFLKSNHKRNSFWKDYIENIPIIDNQLSNDFFENKFKNYFSNIFIILSKIKLIENEIDGLPDNLLNFLAKEQFLNGNNIDYLSNFINFNQSVFTEKNYLDLLKLSISNSKYYSYSNFITVVCKGLNSTSDNYKIEDKKLVEQIFDVFSRSKEGLNNLCILWILTDEEYKKKIENAIRIELNKNFDFDLYITAVLEKIIPYDDYFENAIEFVNTRKGSEIFKYDDDTKEAQLTNLVFYNFIIILHNLKIDRNDSRLKVLTNLSDSMSFLLNPIEFDYSKFRSEWLTAFDISKFIDTPELIAKIGGIVKLDLSKNFNNKLSKIYFKYFSK